MPAARPAGQFGRAAGVTRGDRHHPRGRPGDMNQYLAAVPCDVTAAQRHQLARPQPGADAEHHHRQRRGRASPGRAARPRPRPALPAPPASTAPAPSRPGTASPAAPAGRAPLRRAGTAPTGTCPGSRTPGRQAGHAERLDHVIVQQELPPGGTPRLSEPGQPPHRGGGHRLPPRARRTASLRRHQLAHSCPLAPAPPGSLFKRIRLRHQRAADTPATGSHPQQICGILATERRCHHRDAQRRPGQGSDRGGPRPDRLLPARHHHHPPRPVRQAPLRLRGRPAGPARPLHPVDPHRQRQDRHPAAHPRPSTRPTRPGSPTPGGSAR